jgi:choline dehydrogenase
MNLSPGENLKIQKEADHDLGAIKDGMRFVRNFMDDVNRATEIYPGKTGVTDEELIRYKFWGHHACGSCAIGEVVDTKFKVKGTSNLHVVDASIFPKIPGFFIALPVYIISEKAADTILGKVTIP